MNAKNPELFSFEIRMTLRLLVAFWPDTSIRDPGTACSAYSFLSALISQPVKQMTRRYNYLNVVSLGFALWVCSESGCQLQLSMKSDLVVSSYFRLIISHLEAEVTALKTTLH